MSPIRNLLFDIEMKAHQVNILLDAIMDKLEWVEVGESETSRNAFNAISCFVSLAQNSAADLITLNQNVLSVNIEVTA